MGFHIPNIPVWQSIIIEFIFGLGILIYGAYLWMTRNDNNVLCSFCKKEYENEEEAKGCEEYHAENQDKYYKDTCS